MLLETVERGTPGMRADTVDVRLLNGFEARTPHDRLDLPRSASRLVAYLALQRRWVPRATVAGVLWPETTQQKAQANLRSGLWRVRRVCGHLVESQGERLALAGDVTVDVNALVTTARRLDQGEGPERAWPIPSFTHELLPEWCDDWIAFERERYRLLALHALERLAVWYSREGQLSAALECAFAAVQLEPLRESAHRALITVHMSQGNVSEALRHFGLYCQLLSRELGVGPSREMVALVEPGRFAVRGAVRRLVPEPRATGPVRAAPGHAAAGGSS